MLVKSSSDASSVLGGKNSKLNVVGWAWKMSCICIECSPLTLLGRVHETHPLVSTAIPGARRFPQDTRASRKRGVFFRPDSTRLPSRVLEPVQDACRVDDGSRPATLHPQ